MCYLIHTGKSSLFFKPEIPRRSVKCVAQKSHTGDSESMKSRAMAVWRGLESLKGIPHPELIQDAPASRVRKQLKTLDTCE